MPKPLEGGIAKLVAKSLVAAGMSKPATLTKVTVGTRLPGAASAGTNPSTTDYRARGIVQDYRVGQIDGTLIKQGDRMVRLFAATIEHGAVPEPGDRIAIEGITLTIVTAGVTRDPASATFVAQCRA